MSIKTRLLLSYIAMTFVPVVLFIGIAATIGSLFFARGAGVGNEPAVWQTFNQRNDLLAGAKFMAETDPDRFVDTGFLQKTDEKMNKLQTGLVVMKNGKTIYQSALFKGADVGAELRELPANQARSGWGHKVGGHYTAEKIDMTFSDGSTGTIYLLSDINWFMRNARRIFPILTLSLILIIVLTNGVLTWLMSRSLIKPLYALKFAAERIKEGDLTHSVHLKRKDEIGELGAAFEEMRRRLNESIRLQLQYEENRKELVTNISHDLKTPIAGIQACIEGIRDGIADTEAKREKYMGMIAKKADDMNRLIEELFLFSKLDLKKLPFHMEDLDLAAYMHDYAEELRVDPRLKGTEFEYTLSGVGPAIVTADREKLHRVMTNIVDNSLKYMKKPHPKLSIVLVNGPNEVKVAISDNGAGIEADALPHIFERFYRADSSRNTESGGSGLGLAIVKQIVEGHGGTVWAESRSGEGTRISFTLPKTKKAVGGHEADFDH